VDKHKQALDLARFTIVNGYTHNNNLKKLIKGWNGDSTDLAVRCGNMQIDINTLYMKVLFLILKLLTTNCKHPKKMQDTCEGVKYCMNCNMGL